MKKIHVLSVMGKYEEKSIILSAKLRIFPSILRIIVRKVVTLMANHRTYNALGIKKE